MRTTLKSLTILLFAFFSTFVNAAESAKSKDDFGLRCTGLYKNDPKAQGHVILYSPKRDALFVGIMNRRDSQDIEPVFIRELIIDPKTFEKTSSSINFIANDKNYSVNRVRVGYAIDRSSLRLVEKHWSPTNSRNDFDTVHECELMTDQDLAETIKFDKANNPSQPLPTPRVNKI